MPVVKTFRGFAHARWTEHRGTATIPLVRPAAGDAWYNNTSNRLKFFNGTATKSFAFTDDNITGNAANVTGTVGVANGGSGDNYRFRRT